AAVPRAAGRHALRAHRGHRRRSGLPAARARGRHRGGAARRARGGGEAVRGGARADQPERRRRGDALRERPGADAGGVQGGVPPVRGRRVGEHDRRPRARRPGAPARRARRVRGDALLGEPLVRDVPGARAGGLRLRAAQQPRRGAAPPLPPQARHRRVGRDDVPDRAARGHRPRDHPHEGRARGRRRVPRHRHQDLHHERRPRPGGEHRPPRARQAPRRAAGHEGDLDVPRAEVPPHRGRPPRHAQRGELRLDRAQDGDQGLGHLRDELRRRDRVAGRRAPRGAQGDVPDDERRAARRGDPGARALRGELPERGGLRARPRAGALAQGRAGPRARGRPDHRAPRRAAHAHDDARLRGGGAGARVLGGDAHRRRGAPRGRGGAAGGRRPRGAHDAGDQGVPHGQRVRRHQPRRADARWARLHPRVRHGAVRARRAHRADLRGDERHPGARPRRAQARGGQRPPRQAVLRAAAAGGRRGGRERGGGAARRCAGGVGRAAAEGHDDGRDARHGRPGAGGRGRHRLPADVRSRERRLHVAAHGPRRGGEAAGRERPRRLLRREAQDRALLHDEAAPADARARRDDRGRRGAGDGARRGGVL
ncbi:MAG: Acyl-CoA dehydrogenase, partial [uncultured Gemmatimonadaceae bacterium]